jgi:hypothetical protein
MIQQKEEDQDASRIMFQRERVSELDIEKVHILLEFCFTADNQFLDLFCIETLETQYLTNLNLLGAFLSRSTRPLW